MCSCSWANFRRALLCRGISNGVFLGRWSQSPPGWRALNCLPWHINKTPLPDSLAERLRGPHWHYWLFFSPKCKKVLHDDEWMSFNYGLRKTQINKWRHMSGRNTWTDGQRDQSSICTLNAVCRNYKSLLFSLALDRAAYTTRQIVCAGLREQNKPSEQDGQ